MKYLYTVPAFFCAGLASQAAAQSAQDGFYYDGYAELGYFDGGDGNTIGYSDATIGYTDAASGFGGELGVEAVIADGDLYSALYGVLTYQSSFGKLSFGVPRSVVDSYLAYVPTLGGITFYNFGELSLSKRSYVGATYLFTDEETPVGLRYDGAIGTANVGASYSRYDDLDVYNLAANTKFGQTTVTGAIDYLKDGTTDEARYFFGVETNFGQVTAGLLLAQNAYFNDRTSVEAYAKYKPMDQLELTVSALDIGISGIDTAYGLSADYTFSQGLYVKAGVVDAFTSSDTAYNVAFGLRF